MHAAPPVRMACDVGGGWRRAHALVAASAAAVFVVWAGRWLQFDAAVTAAAAVLAAGAAGLFALRAMAQRRCDLDWDGQRWRVTDSDAEGGAVEVVFDLGSWMLLRWTTMPGRQARWLTVRRVDAGGGWAAWRAALYGPVPRAEAAPPRR